MIFFTGIQGGSRDLPRGAGAVYTKRARAVSQHHDDARRNPVKRYNKCLILLTEFAGVVQW